MRDHCKAWTFALLLTLIAATAYAGTLTKTLASPFTAPVGSYATALSGNVAKPTNTFSCAVAPEVCQAIAVTVTVKHARQSELLVRAYAANLLVVFPAPTTESDGSLKYSSAVRVTGSSSGTTWPVRLELQSAAGPAITLEPSAGDKLVLGASTAP